MPRARVQNYLQPGYPTLDTFRKIILKKNKSKRCQAILRNHYKPLVGQEKNRYLLVNHRRPPLVNRIQVVLLFWITPELEKKEEH